MNLLWSKKSHLFLDLLCVSSLKAKLRQKDWSDSSKKNCNKSKAWHNCFILSFLVNCFSFFMSVSAPIYTGDEQGQKLIVPTLRCPVIKEWMSRSFSTSVLKHLGDRIADPAPNLLALWLSGIGNSCMMPREQTLSCCVSTIAGCCCCKPWLWTALSFALSLVTALMRARGKVSNTDGTWEKGRQEELSLADSGSQQGVSSLFSK